MSAQVAGVLTPDAAQAAEILGVRREAEQIVSLNRTGAEPDRVDILKSHVLRRIFHGILQVQNAQNRLESEMAYAYDVMAREQRKTNTVNQFFNIINFLQFGVLYTIEPRSRIHKQFTQSAVCSTVGAGLGLGLPILCILYNKMAKAGHLAPPSFLANVIDGKPVDGSNLPIMLVRYLDLSAPDSNNTRREELNALWKKRYHADLSKKETLAGIDDGKSKNIFVLNTRIVLLWSLYSFIQGFNRDLLSLLNQIRGESFVDLTGRGTKYSTSSELTGGAAEAAYLLQLEPVVAELRSLGAGASERKTKLQTKLLETVLAGYLDLQIAADKCQNELNYQYDVVLAQLLARRGKFLQKTFELNFIQQNTLGACAGWSYLNHYPKAGNELFIVADSIGMGITTISLLGTHGGWRRNETGPNSLADFFNLQKKENYGFSPLVWNFLNSTSPKRSDGKTRRQYLHESWKDQSVATIDIEKEKNREKLGSMPSCKWDSIKLVRNRIALLSSLHEQLQHFDAELLDFLRATWPVTPGEDAAVSSPDISPAAARAANLLSANALVAKVRTQQADNNDKLLLTRIILEAFLCARADSNLLARQILLETQVMDKMTRQRDLAIQLTNIVNFYQIGILGVIADSLGLSSNDQYVLVGDRINIISGLMVSCLAMAALLERHGGVRLSKAEPNSLSAAFSDSPQYASLSPLMSKYLRTQAPGTNMSRREQLMKYWKEAKVLSVNVKRESMMQKLSAQGRSHHWWDETIHLISNRVTMLYDLRATLRTSNNGFDELISALE